MEKRDIKIELCKESNNVYILRFILDDNTYKINLNDEDQSNLKIIYYDIISLLLKKIKPIFELDYDKENLKNSVFIDVATEYVKCLNSEINKIEEDLSKNIKEF